MSRGNGVKGGTVSRGNGVRGERCQVPFWGRQGLRMVFGNPNCATAFFTHGSEPYGLLRLMAYRILSISSFGCGWFGQGT